MKPTLPLLRYHHYPHPSSHRSSPLQLPLISWHQAWQPWQQHIILVVAVEAMEEVEVAPERVVAPVELVQQAAMQSEGLFLLPIVEEDPANVSQDFTLSLVLSTFVGFTVKVITLAQIAILWFQEDQILDQTPTFITTSSDMQPVTEALGT